MSPLIQKPDIALRLKKFLGLTELPDSVLAPEVVATIEVGNVTEGVLTRQCMGSRIETAVAMEFPIIALRSNPAAGAPRDVQIVLTKVVVSSGTTQQIILGNTGAVLGVLVAGEKAFADNDLVGNPSSEIGGATNVAIPAMNDLIRHPILANTPREFLILQGRGFKFGVQAANLFQNSFIVVGASVNTNLQASFEWSESEPDRS